jgi:hypothetical protein
MLLEGQSRGWAIHYGQLDGIWLCDGEAFRRLTRLEVTDDRASRFTAGDVAVTPLGELDVILMRKDPPFDTEYIFATYVLERVVHGGNVDRPDADRLGRSGGVSGQRLVGARSGRVLVAAFACRLVQRLMVRSFRRARHVVERLDEVSVVLVGGGVQRGQ